jgi:hypothetical protein
MKLYHSPKRKTETQRFKFIWVETRDITAEKTTLSFLNAEQTTATVILKIL